jgi:hypothetical protein
MESPLAVAVAAAAAAVALVPLAVTAAASPPLALGQPAALLVRAAPLARLRRTPVETAAPGLSGTVGAAAAAAATGS